MNAMDWPMTPERRALAAAVTQMCESDDPTPALTQAGIPWIGLPETLGGCGGELEDAATAVRALAMHAHSAPVAETAIAAGWALAQTGLQIPNTYLAPAFDVHNALRLTQSSTSTTITGVARNVPALAHCDYLVVNAEQHICLIDKAAVEIQWSVNVADEDCSTVLFENTPIHQLATLDPRFTAIDLFARLAFARAVQLSGALIAVRDLTIEYAKTREQFGKPIASMQIIAHYLAELAELALTGEGAIANAIEQPTTANFAIAKSVTSRAARQASRVAHQVHGAMGISQEYALGYLTTHMWAWTEDAGRPEFWNTYLGDSFLAQSDRNLWTSITNGMEGEHR